MSREGEEEEDEGEKREEADLLSADHRLRRPAGLEKRNSRYNQWNRHVILPLFYLPAEKIYGKSTPSTMLHRKKRFTSFPCPAGMSLTKLPLGRNNLVMTSLFPPRESLVVTSRLGTGNSRTFFLRCSFTARLKI